LRRRTPRQLPAEHLDRRPHQSDRRAQRTPAQRRLPINPTATIAVT
jgi:hypothetical protein